jgi:hypothetical protein
MQAKHIASAARVGLLAEMQSTPILSPSQTLFST